MKKITIALILLLLCGVSSHIFYSKAESVINNMQVITQAIKQKDTPVLIKELVEKIKSETEIDEARYPALIKEVETYAASCDKPEEAAILHSLIAEMYSSFERQNSWKYRQRTPIVGYVPEDINEWTTNLFKEKIKEEYLLSLQPEEVLQKTPISRYAELLQSGKDEGLRPTLYDCLIYRVLGVEPTVELYQKLISYKRGANNLKALMLAELDYAEFTYRNTSFSHDRSAYLASLDSLYTIYSASDFAAEIWISRLGVMEMMTYTSENPNVSPVNAEIMALCERAIKEYPSYERISVFKNKLVAMQNPILNVTMPVVLYPAQEVKLKLDYKNVTSITIKVYETDLKPEEVNVSAYWFEQNQNKRTINRKIIRQIQASLDIQNTYQSTDTTMWINGLDNYGVYEYEISVPGTKLKSSQFVFVSKTTAVSRTIPTGGAEVLVTDLQTGKPIDKALVLLYKSNQRKAVLVDSVQTDSDGIAKINNTENSLYFRAVTKDDRFTPFSSIYLGNHFGETRNDKEEKTQVALFTDRGLYRPGQSVSFKGIAYSGDKDNRIVSPNRTFKVILRDANHKEVVTRDFKTNEFGSFNGEFTLPQQGLNGRFTLSTENTTVSIQVEEYKRPSFNIEISPVKGEIAFGDTVKIEGKAQTYSGIALQAGKVNYRVLLCPFRFFSYGIPSFAETQKLQGETTLDENGNFSFDFVPEKQTGAQPWANYVSYAVIATVSDSKGETQETNALFSVGSSSIVLSTNLSGQMKNENLSVQVSALTLNGEPASAQGNYTIYNLIQEKKKGATSFEQKEGSIVAKGQFTTDEPISPNVFSELASGGYRIKFEASDAKKRPVELTQDVILYTEKDKRPPVFSDIWLVTNGLTAQPGENVEFIFGTSHKKAYVLYELVSANKVVSRKRLDLTDENRKITVPFLESYGDGVVALFTFVKDGKLYTRQLSITKKMPDKTLTIKTETFRDKLIPGNKENWTLKVLTPDSLPATAEVLASMYDASLDAITSFNWYLSVWNGAYVNASAFRENHSYLTTGLFMSGEINYADVPVFDYSQFDWEKAMLRTYAYATRQSSSVNRMKSAAPAADMVMAESVVEEVSVQALDQLAGDAHVVDGGNKEVSLRQNFNETAFFFPVLRTDKDGVFTVNFTLPESNTTWKFQTLAHTKDMSYGQLTKELISSKPLMVLPNLPRFVRQGDEVTISTQVINRSDDTLTGKVRLELFDPATDEIIVCLTKSQFPFDLASGEQTTAKWTIPVPAGRELLGVRIIADSETISDGEQHLLPVLSNEVLVTESTPIYLKGDGEKVIPVPGNNKASYRPYLQTLEISANPIWYAVQALPTLTRPANNSASAWFASYYSNILATSIVKANPRMRTIIDQWTAAGKDAASLLSNLEKNEELKQILLEETPWVLEAEKETEQIQRLNTLFDLNRAESQRAEALQELIRLQREDGAWGWFNGFGADRYVTTSILQGMADLINLNAVEYAQSEKEMQMNALRYLDNEIVKEYKVLRKHTQNWKNVTPSEWQLDYIFMRSLYRDIPEMTETREAIRFYTDQAEKQWEKLPVRMRVQTALILHRNGKREKSATIMNWFKRTATQSEEQGLYWANNRRNGFSPVSPIETHTLLMTAFAEIPVKDMDVDKMKQWLLNQKRTQNWETAPATLNAIYVLLLTGGDWLAENNRVIANWGKDMIDTQDGTIGVGYSKTVRKSDEIERNEKLTIRKEGNTPAWGALYSQYFVPMDQVTKHKGDLSIEKKIFVEKASEKGLQLVALQDGETLRVGDKAIVRLTIRTKQEMTYVHLKDMRAGCFEPADQLSGTQYRDGVFYYRSSKDVSEQFFFDRLPEGTFVLEYGVYVSRTGEYASGPATIQCLYAPEYTSHTAGGYFIIKD